MAALQLPNVQRLSLADFEPEERRREILLKRLVIFRLNSTNSVHNQTFTNYLCVFGAQKEETALRRTQQMVVSSHHGRVLTSNACLCKVGFVHRFAEQRDNRLEDRSLPPRAHSPGDFGKGKT